MCAALIELLEVGREDRKQKLGLVIGVLNFLSSLSFSPRWEDSPSQLSIIILHSFVVQRDIGYCFLESVNCFW